MRGEGYGALLIMQLDCSDAHDEHGAGGVWTDVFCNKPILENIYMINYHQSGSIEGGKRRSLLPAIDFGQSGVTDVPGRGRGRHGPRRGTVESTCAAPGKMDMCTGRMRIHSSICGW